MNQRHVRTHAMPEEHNNNTIDPKEQSGVTKQEKFDRINLKISPVVMETKRKHVQKTIKAMPRTIDKRAGFKAVFHFTTKLLLAPKIIATYLPRRQV